MTIVHCAYSGAGGTGSFVSELCPRLREDGGRATSVVFYGVEPLHGDYGAALDDAGIPYCVVPKRPGIDLPSCQDLARTLRAQRPAVTVLHGGGTAWKWPILRTLGVRSRLVVVEHGPESAFCTPRGFFEHLISLGCADAVIAVSDRLAEALRRAFPTLERGIRVYAVPNGVDTGFFTPGDEPRRPGSVLMAGTLSPSKDHATLLDAVALLAGKRPVELLLAGDGILRADLERRATDLRVQTHVRFLGTASRADLLRLYRQTAVFAFSTKGEGSPLAMLEAMACGLPVAASDVPGVREILEGGRRGLPVSPGDAAAMASAIERLLDDPESARRLGVAARQYVEVEHSASRMAARYGEILNAF